MRRYGLWHVPSGHVDWWPNMAPACLFDHTDVVKPYSRYRRLEADGSDACHLKAL